MSSLLNICHWNVEGLSGGEKLSDHAFTELVKNNDIVCLSETHCGVNDIISKEGYNCFKLCRKITKRINRYFGGIAVLYKEHLKEGMKFLTHKNDDCMDKTLKNLFWY